MGTSLKVAVGDPWECDEAVVRPCSLRVDHLTDHVGSERVVLCLEDGVEKEQLPHHVGDVEEFRDKEENDQIVSRPTTIALFCNCLEL